MKTIKASKVDKGQLIFVRDKKRYLINEEGEKRYLICDKCNNSNWESVDDNPLHIKSKCGETYVF